MKLYVTAASDPFDSDGRIVECESLEKYFDEVVNTHDFGDHVPQIIISRPDKYGKYVCPEAVKECDYEVLIYDGWIE